MLRNSCQEIKLNFCVFAIKFPRRQDVGYLLYKSNEKYNAELTLITVY